MQVINFVGVDVSKKSLDVSWVVNAQELFHETLENNSRKIQCKISQWMRKLGATFENTLFCLEFTGVYSLPLLQCLTQMGAIVWAESGVQIRRSLGMIRGKNDQVDSQRIAQYAFTHQHQARPWKAPRTIIEQLTALVSQRDLLVKIQKQLSTSYKEKAAFLKPTVVKNLRSHATKLLSEVKKQILQIEAEMLALISSDEKLNNLYEIITSIPGLGLVTTVHVITTTNEFLNFNNPKKYACYCGVAPFEHTSGTSVRGKIRVSHFANKTMKSLLHPAALGAIESPGELREFYLRKVEEGKNKMSVLNAVRNKLVLRIFSCVGQNRFYERNFNLNLELS